MKNILIVAVLSALILSACSGDKSPSSSEAPPSSDASSNLQVSVPDEIPTEIPSAIDTRPPVPADSALYRGSIETLTDNGFILIQAGGRDYGSAFAEFIIDDNTRSEVDFDELAVGMYMEVYYGAPVGSPTDHSKPHNAIQVNKLTDEAEGSVYNGEVVSTKYKEGKTDEGTILMKPFDSDYQTAFHFNSETNFYMDMAKLIEGAKLNILRSPFETRSIPPQTNAFEVTLYDSEVSPIEICY